jgi:hypothetical protein
MVSLSTLITNLAKLSRLSPYRQKLFLTAILLLPLLNLSLYFLGYFRLRKILEKIIPFKNINICHSDAEIITQARDITQIVSIAVENGLIHATCLQRSMLGWLLLRREGVQGNICFGVRMNDCQLEAHAWIEYNGVVVNDSVSILEKYKPLSDALPPNLLGL